MQHKRYDISIEDLRQLLSYNPETGHLTWLPRPLRFCKSEREQARWNSRCAGKKVIMTMDNGGYLRFKLFDVLYKAHRVCWAMHHGEWPPQNMQIDHINRCPSDNRILNIRLANPTQNRVNQPKRIALTSRYKGVFWDKGKGAWCSKIKKGPLRLNLGFFSSEEEAYNSYCNAGEELFGEFFHP